MDIYTFKKHFEGQVQPTPAQVLVSAEAAWACFLATLWEPQPAILANAAAFSAGAASYFDGHTRSVDETLFQIYFGRIIDAPPGQPWSFAELDFYYRFEMRPELRHWLTAPSAHETEIAYSLAEGEDVIRQKHADLAAFVEARHRLWDEVRELKPGTADFHFWIW
jgi:hypothetical protein